MPAPEFLIEPVESDVFYQELESPSIKTLWDEPPNYLYEQISPIGYIRLLLIYNTGTFIITPEQSERLPSLLCFALEKEISLDEFLFCVIGFN